MQTKLPRLLFLLACVLFFATYRQLRLLQEHYTAVHFYFGLCAPLLTGYAPTSLFVCKPWYRPSLNVAWSWRWEWNFRPAVLFTFFASFINEVIDDPRQNGIPFVEAWQHFAADQAGLLCFCLAYVIVLRKAFIHTPSS